VKRSLVSSSISASAAKTTFRFCSVVYAEFTLYFQLPAHLNDKQLARIAVDAVDAVRQVPEHADFTPTACLALKKISEYCMRSDASRHPSGACVDYAVAGVVPSFSRPHLSDDNPYSEWLFRTLKYTPAYPRLPFADAQAARRWVERFVDWYNSEYRHSAIRFVTPDERHCGCEHAILARRHQFYERARASNLERWSRAPRNWTPIGLVVLNPPRADLLAAA
jgi:hypothetical protein